jgi:uncharacterized membrane protein YphA (DoxX/SURF4 family)
MRKHWWRRLVPGRVLEGFPRSDYVENRPMPPLRPIFATKAPASTVRVLVGAVFLSEGVQKFLFPEALGIGRFAKMAQTWRSCHQVSSVCNTRSKWGLKRGYCLSSGVPNIAEFDHLRECYGRHALRNTRISSHLPTAPEHRFRESSPDGGPWRLRQYWAKIGIPAPQVMAPFVGTVEIACGSLILAGLLTRPAAILLIADMLVAIATTKVPMLIHDGFWKMAHEARTDLSMLLGSIFLFIVGSGRWGLDPVLSPESAHEDG